MLKRQTIHTIPRAVSLSWLQESHVDNCQNGVGRSDVAAMCLASLLTDKDDQPIVPIGQRSGGRSEPGNRLPRLSTNIMSMGAATAIRGSHW